MNKSETTEDEIVWRRFGRDHDKPCKRPSVTTCAMWECQKANECQWDEATGARRLISQPTSMAGDTRETTADERLALCAIDQGFGAAPGGYMDAKFEALVPDLIRRGLVTQHTIWRLTKAGEEELANG